MQGSCASNKETVNCACPSVVTDIEESEWGNVATVIREEETENDELSLVTCEDGDESDHDLCSDEEIDNVSVAESIENMD